MRFLLAFLIALLPLNVQAEEMPAAGYSIRVIYSDTGGSIEQAVTASDNLHTEIVRLAQRDNTLIWFRTYVNETMVGAPAIILECPDNFMPSIRQLPGYVRDHLATTLPSHATRRILP